MNKEQEIAMRQCYDCVHKRTVPGNCHIECANPDPDMQGEAHRIRNGWWNYPFLFDPTWNITLCANHETRPV